MIYLGFFILAFALLRWLVSLVNLLSFPYLPGKSGDVPDEKISVLIPARNEEKNLGKLLEDLEKWDYPRLEILVYNDESTDGTSAVIEHHQRRNPCILQVESRPLPEGWLGKNHACHQLAARANGDYLLFLDADVRVGKDLPLRALAHMRRHKLHLLSLFPQQIMISRGEKITVPIMNWILLSLLPLFLIRKSRWISFTAANGQFMLFHGDTYRKQTPHNKFSRLAVEDIAILRYYKKLRLKTETLLGDRDIQCRMYASREEAIQGFTKNILHFFGNRLGFALFVAFVSTFGLIIVGLANGLQAGLLYLFIGLSLRIFTSVASRQNAFTNLFYLIPQQGMFIRILWEAIYSRKRKKMIWKERNIGV